MEKVLSNDFEIKIRESNGRVRNSTWIEREAWWRRYQRSFMDQNEWECNGLCSNCPYQLGFDQDITGECPTNINKEYIEAWEKVLEGKTVIPKKYERWLDEALNEGNGTYNP